MGLQSASQPRLSYAEMAEDYPRYPDIHDLDLTLLNPRMIVVRRAAPLRRLCCPWPIPVRAELATQVTRVVSALQDVTPYMNPSPFTVSPNTHVSQVFNLFRTMGLRHLPVVNAVGEVSPSSAGGWGPRRPASTGLCGPPPTFRTTAAVCESGLRSPRTRESPSGISQTHTSAALPPGVRGEWAGGAWRGFANLSRCLLLPMCCLLRGRQMSPGAQWPCFLHPRKAQDPPSSQTSLLGGGGSPSVHKIK